MRDFIFGAVIGAAALYGSMSFHVVQAEDGYHFVPKTALTFRDTFVDIRQFNFMDWRDHVPLAEAIMNSQRHELVRDSAQSAVQNAFENLLNRQSR